MKTIRNLAMAAAFVGMTAVPAQADTGGWGFSGCGGNNFATCMSGNLQWERTATQTLITISVMNNGTNGEVFKAIGLIGIPAGVSASTTSQPSGWTSPANELGGGGLPGGFWSSKAPNPAPSNGLQSGAPALAFSFTLGRVLTDGELAGLGVGVHAISGPTDLTTGGTCSTKMGVVNGQVVDNADAAAYANCGATVIPEPTTMILLGTGLAGVVGMARRRKNGLELEGDEA